MLLPNVRHKLRYGKLLVYCKIALVVFWRINSVLTNAGETALHYALGYHGIKSGEITFDNLAVTQHLIDSGASLGIQELCLGNTAFHIAANKQQFQFLEVSAGSLEKKNSTHDFF